MHAYLNSVLDPCCIYLRVPEVVSCYCRTQAVHVIYRSTHSLFVPSLTTTASPFPADEVKEGDAEDEDGDREDDEEGRQELRINLVARFHRPRLYRWLD